MSHKDYVLLADALHEARKELDLTSGREVLAWTHATLAVAAALQRDNSRFDRERFLAAARGEPVNGRDRVRP
jgi:hypothetical protein